MNIQNLDQNKINQIKKLSFILFIYTLLVILWGAWVRISHSGDGCGDTWPLCGGQLIPQGSKKTWIEYSHRLTSGIYGLFVLYLFIKSKSLFKELPKFKYFFNLALIFTITEAMLGAKLVLFGLVGQNSSSFRLFIMSLHQLNSMLLSAFVFLAFYSIHFFIKYPDRKLDPIFQLKTYKFSLAYLVLAVSGAIAALATTLFPSESLLEGFLKDFSSDAHMLTRLRILHPLIASFLGAFMIYRLSQSIKSSDEKLIKSIQLDKSLQTLLVIVVLLIVGLITLVTLSPIPLKIFHLLLAHLGWVFVLRWCIYKTSQD